MARFAFATSTTAKLLVLAVLAIFLMLPLSLIHRLVLERARTADAAQERIAASWGREQSLLLPMLRMDFVRERMDDKLGLIREQQTRLLSPAAAQVQATLTGQTRSLGIYSLPIYSAELRIEGRYTPSASLAPPSSSEGWTLARSTLEFAPGDLTGLREIRQLVVGAQDVQLKPSAERWELGRVIDGFSYGNRPVLSGELLRSPENLLEAESIPFAIELEIAGARSLNFIPNAADFSLSIRGDWPHPGFAAGALPREREVNAQGFSAHWRLLDLSTGIPAVLSSAAQLSGWGAQAVGVSLVEPGGLYQQNERSSKYGVLLLALTIAALFLTEVLLGVRLHPFHYALVGMALAVFYLLLIAVSEHVGFLGAYLLAALAVIAMIGGYLSALLHSWKRGALAALVLGTLYSFLLVLIRAEELSLLLGAIGLAVLLALVMYLTRRLNWYGPVSTAEQDSFGVA